MNKPAPKGNQFWKLRSSHGRKPIFPDAETLWNACCEYFEWVEENPLYEAKAFAYQGMVTVESLPKMRAMTIGSLCIFIDISKRGWDNYRERPEYKEVCDKVEEIIRTQKFQGAAADLLNHAIIARELGLADKSELTGAEGGPLEISWKESDDGEA